MMRFVALILAAIILFADQVSKWWIVARFLGDDHRSLGEWLVWQSPQFHLPAKEITSFFNMVLVWNPGVSFGMLQSDKPYIGYGLTAMAVLVAIGFFVWLWREPLRLRAVAVGLIVGGALGNVWDRVRFGAVVDFVDLHIAGYHWPAFNVADAAIVIGVILLLVETFFFVPSESRMEKSS